MVNNHFLFDKILDTSANQEEILELLNAISCQQRQEKEFCMVRLLYLWILLSSTLNDVDINF